LSERITAALKEMECPFLLAAHQIQGLDYGKVLPCQEWLIRKLQESRDTRAALNRRQGLLNYNRRFKKAEPAPEDFVPPDQNQFELAKVKEVIFEGKPKRAYQTNRNLEEVSV